MRFLIKNALGGSYIASTVEARATHLLESEHVDSNQEMKGAPTKPLKTSYHVYVNLVTE